MPTTTFAGPVKAGGISTSTGTTLSENVANQGFAKMVQVADVTQAELEDPAWTDIVIPANSQITRIAALVTAAADTNALSIGRSDSVSTDYFWFVNALDVASLGLKEALGTKVASPDNWKDIGDIDCHVTYWWGETGASPGVATLIVEYVQNNNLTA